MATSTNDGAPRVPEAALRELGARALRAAGVPDEDAAIVARVMVANEMRGISHGVALLAPYIRHIEAGGMNATPRITIERDVGATLVLNGDGGLGPLISYRAMELAIERARRHGVAFVVARDGNNFAAAGYYAKMAADAGMVGVAMTNADPYMAVAGGAGRTVGNNPLGCAVPGVDGQAVYLDIAMSAVAGTKLAIAAREGRSIPEGWALDADGAPATDPSAVREGGSLVPVGGYKGSGLAVLIECLTGVLGGAAIMAEMRDWVSDPGGAQQSGAQLHRDRHRAAVAAGGVQGAHGAAGGSGPRRAARARRGAHLPARRDRARAESATRCRTACRCAARPPPDCGTWASWWGSPPRWRRCCGAREVIEDARRCSGAAQSLAAEGRGSRGCRPLFRSEESSARTAAI